MDNAGTRLDTENNIHGVNCIRNASTVEITDETPTAVEETEEIYLTEQNKSDPDTHIENKDPNRRHDHLSNSLLISLCVFCAVSNVLIIIGAKFWTKRVMFKTNYNCIYNPGLEGRSPVATGNDYETVLVGDGACCASNIDNI